MESPGTACRAPSGRAPTPRDPVGVKPHASSPGPFGAKAQDLKPPAFCGRAPAVIAFVHMEQKREPDDVRMAVAASIGRFLLGAGAGFFIWSLLPAEAMPVWLYSFRSGLAIGLVWGLMGAFAPRLWSSFWPRS
jgi:hypothetical protein